MEKDCIFKSSSVTFEGAFPERSKKKGGDVLCDVEERVQAAHSVSLWLWDCAPACGHGKAAQGRLRANIPLNSTLIGNK